MTKRQELELWGSVKIENFDGIEDVLKFYKDFYIFNKVENLRIFIDTSDDPNYDISERQLNELKDFWLNSKEYFEKAKKGIFEYIKLDKANGNP